MAPSLPGRRSTTRGSSSSLRRENSFGKRDQKRESEDESDDEEHSTRRTSARSKRPVRKATTKAKIVDIPLEAYEEDEEEEEDNDMASVATDDVASGEGDGDGEENEGEMDDSGEAKITMNGELLGGKAATAFFIGILGTNCKAFSFITEIDICYSTEFNGL